MTLEQLKAALAEKTKGLTDLQTKALADDATKEDSAALAKALDECDVLKDKIALAERAATMAADVAQPAQTPVSDAQKVAAKPTAGLKAFDKIGLATGALIKSNVTGGDRSWRGTADTLDKMGYGEVASEFDVMQRTMNTGTGSAGGFAVPEDFNEQIFEELMPYTGFLRGGPDIMPMPSGNHRQSGLASRPTSGYRAEAAAIAVTDATLREISLSAKLLSAATGLSNQVINYTGNRMLTAASGALRRSIGLAMDTAAFEGSGTGNAPTGILTDASAIDFTAATGTAPAIGVVEGELRKLINVIALYATLGINVAWVMPQRVKGYLEDLRDGNGNKYFPELSAASPMLKGYPVIVTGTIATNGGAGTNEARIGLVSFGNILMGETGTLNIAVSDQATMNGVSAFENDMTYIKATMEHDWQSRYNEAVCVLDGVQWGA